jgi:hypothetical protein
VHDFFRRYYPDQVGRIISERPLRSSYQAFSHDIPDRMAQRLLEGETVVSNSLAARRVLRKGECSEVEGWLCLHMR